MDDDHDDADDDDVRDGLTIWLCRAQNSHKRSDLTAIEKFGEKRNAPEGGGLLVSLYPPSCCPTPPIFCPPPDSDLPPDYNDFYTAASFSCLPSSWCPSKHLDRVITLLYFFPFLFLVSAFLFCLNYYDRAHTCLCAKSRLHFPASLTPSRCLPRLIPSRLLFNLCQG